jgi:hypothetical protein
MGNVRGGTYKCVCSQWGRKGRGAAVATRDVACVYVITITERTHVTCVLYHARYTIKCIPLGGT